MMTQLPGRSQPWTVVSEMMGTTWSVQLGQMVYGHIIRFRTGTGLPALVVITPASYTPEYAAQVIGAEGARVERMGETERGAYLEWVGANRADSPWAAPVLHGR